MDSLEHKIKEAFNQSDTNTTFPHKATMWNRIDRTVHSSKGIAAWWRVAAVFMALFLVAGVYAGFNIHKNQQDTLRDLQSKNTELQHIIDSILASPVQTKTETKIVEKVIYRDRTVPLNKADINIEWQGKYRQLEDSTQIILTRQKMEYQKEKERLQKALQRAKEELYVLQKQNQQTQKKENEPFLLKSEQVNMGIQNNSVPKNPDIELKVFPRNFTENKNDINRTLLKKK